MSFSLLHFVLIIWKHFFRISRIRLSFLGKISVQLLLMSFGKGMLFNATDLVSQTLTFSNTSNYWIGIQLVPTTTRYSKRYQVLAEKIAQKLIAVPDEPSNEDTFRQIKHLKLKSLDFLELCIPASHDLLREVSEVQRRYIGSKLNFRLQ